MYSFLTSYINDAHRRDLLREAESERLAHAFRQARVSAPARRRVRQYTPLISIDAVIYQASIALDEPERAALCCDETS